MSDNDIIEEKLKPLMDQFMDICEKEGIKSVICFQEKEVGIHWSHNINGDALPTPLLEIIMAWFKGELIVRVKEPQPVEELNGKSKLH